MAEGRTLRSKATTNAVRLFKLCQSVQLLFYKAVHRVCHKFAVAAVSNAVKRTVYNTVAVNRESSFKAYFPLLHI